MQACAANSRCVVASWNGNCYLKSGLGSPNPNSNVWGARLLSARVPPTTTAVPTSTTPLPQTITVTTTVSNEQYKCQCTLAPTVAQVTCPQDNNSTYTSECGAQYVIECYADRYGDDLPNGYSQQPTLADCIEDCSDTPGCVDISWVVGGACYKKGSYAAIRENDNIWGARQISGCTASSSPSMRKLHRKRVVRSDPERKPKAPLSNLQTWGFGKRDDAEGLAKRGIAYGPDATYVPGVTTVTRTSAATVTVTT